MGYRIAGVLLAGLASSPATAEGLIETNQAYVEAVTRKEAVPVGDPVATFAFVFKALPEQVKVYPTEDYYYFKFFSAGVPYGGNIRLEYGTRDEGKVHFAYGQESRSPKEGDGTHRLIGPAEGLRVEKLAPLAYRLTFRDKSVTFALNDLSAVKPPAGLLRADETYIGPVFDESAMRFFLVFNSRLKLFHYILDETAPVPDELVKSAVDGRILIGRRTGFAFYRDERLTRKILIGVREDNVRANNYFDGPFDQLPDNFVDGTVLRDAIVAMEPDLKGRLDRFGSTFDGAMRYAITPYLAYDRESDLRVFVRCASNRRIPADRRYACFAIDENASGPRPRTLAERPSRGR
ncbi:MAG: hypothetical protein J0H62_03220 [Rhizobiales bacterium]|nr:hypothetical protein [Hyphomicrobiales bacterium]